MTIFSTIIAVIMVVIGAFYIWVSGRIRHVVLFIGGLFWLAGAQLAYRRHDWWVIFIVIVYAIVLLLNINPEHD